MRGPYAFSDYDGNFSLKPPFLLWVAILYLSRAIVLPLAIAVGSFAGVGSDAKTLLRGVIDVNTLVPSAVAGIVLFAACRRLPTAPGLIRWIWSRGRVLLALAAVLDLGLAIGTVLLSHGEGNDSPVGSLLGGAMDLYCLLYILGARRVRDTFADFPAPVPTP